MKRRGNNSMNHVITKIRLRGNSNKFRKVLSDVALYSLPEDLTPYVPYAPNHNLDEDSWFGIPNFSQQEYCIDFLKEAFVSTAFDMLISRDIDKMDYICAVQDENYFFQKVSKKQLLSKKAIRLGDVYSYSQGGKEIVINDVADAIYVKNEDTLYFKKLTSITRIFKGIDSLYREATEVETQDFLAREFIDLTDGFDSTYVKKANRKRIAMAIDLIDNFEDEQKEVVFNTIKDYCPDLVAEDGAFKITTDNDLKLLLYGIDQRFYTTPDGKEKRIANSVISLNGAANAI